MKRVRRQNQSRAGDSPSTTQAALRTVTGRTHRHLPSSVRLRSWLVRHPRLYWSALVMLAWLAASSVNSHVRQLDRTRATLGSTIEVWVAVEDIPRGEAVVAERRSVPAAFVPKSAITNLEPHSLARQSISVGELLVAADVVADSNEFVPDGWVVVAVVESPSSHTTRGEMVRVASGGIVIADEAIVIDAATDRTLVAVPNAVGALVASANQQADVALLRVIGG